MTITATALAHPSWCSDHTGFDDGSDDWHRSADVEAGEMTFYLSTGTLSGEPEVFFPGPGPGEGISVAQARELGTALLALVEGVRGMNAADCITDEGDALRIQRHPDLSDAQWTEISAVLLEMAKEGESMTTTEANRDPATEHKSPRRKRHSAPNGRIGAAREMGVQWRSDCGRWLWYEFEVVLLDDLSDPPRELRRQCFAIRAARGEVQR